MQEQWPLQVVGIYDGAAGSGLCDVGRVDDLNVVLPEAAHSQPLDARDPLSFLLPAAHLLGLVASSNGHREKGHAGRVFVSGNHAQQ